MIVVAQFRTATELPRQEVEMSSSELNPQILVNGEEQQQQQQQQLEEQQQQMEEEAAAAEGQMSSVDLDKESSEAAEKEKQAKVQSLFQHVRTQIRSQVSMKATKNSILELMQRVREMETAQVNGEPEGEDVSGEGKEEAADESKDEMDVKQEELCAIFDKKLEASEKALRDEFRVQISQVRADMQAYTDQALRDLECKMNSRQPHSLQQQQESRGPDRKQKPSAPSSLAPRRGRVLTRTMTTIIPKTCAPVIIGPRAKSETLSCSKGESSRLVLRDPLLPAPGYKQCPSRKPLLPPACPPLQQRKRPVRPKAQTEN